MRAPTIVICKSSATMRYLRGGGRERDRVGVEPSAAKPGRECLEHDWYMGRILVCTNGRYESGIF
jgi:hypothetical protein